MNQSLLVTKRDGTTERINLDKIHRVLDWAAEGELIVSLVHQIRQNMRHKHLTNFVSYRPLHCLNCVVLGSARFLIHVKQLIHCLQSLENKQS